MNPWDIYRQNSQYLKPNQPQSYQTQLGPAARSEFLRWRMENNIPYDPSPTSDYDMQGFFMGLATGDPRAQSAVNPYDNAMHFSDTWKTPFHQSFSRESQWAHPTLAPQWVNNSQLADSKGWVIFDEQQAKRFQPGQLRAALQRPVAR